MKTKYNNQPAVETQKSEPKVRFQTQDSAKASEFQNRTLSVAFRTQTEKLARELLNANLAPTSEWACDLDVAERTVRAWAVGDKNIPAERVDQIIYQSKAYSLRLDVIERQVDEWLYLQYGTTKGNDY
jgi:hypothetical protein